MNGILLQALDGPRRKRPRKSRKTITWATNFDFVEFNSKKTRSNTINNCMQGTDVVSDDYDDYDFLPGFVEDWELIVQPPQFDPLHTKKANDRSMAYARRRALDLERVPGVNDVDYDPVIVVLWDEGLAEKVEYGFTDYTSKRGLPRPPKVKDVKRWSRPDALSIKSHVMNMTPHILLEEFWYQ